jgi:hypothetical protein
MNSISLGTLISLILGALTWLATDDPGVRTAAWALGIVLLGVQLAFRSGHSFDIFSPGFFVGITFAVAYGVAACLPLLRDSADSQSGAAFSALDRYPEASAVALFTLLGFVAGYNQLWRWLHARGASFLRFRAIASSEWRAALVMTAIGYAALLAAVGQNLFFHGAVEDRDPLIIGVVGFGFQFVYVALALAVAKAIEIGSREWQLLAVLSFVAVVGSGIASGSKGAALIGIVVVVLAWNYCRRRIMPVRAVVMTLLLCVVLAVLFPANMLYRAAMQETLQSDLPAHTAAARASQEAIYAFTEIGAPAFMKLGYDYLFSRLSNVDVVANVLKRQEEGMELAWGETYARIVPAFVPRFIWPDKPSISLSNELAVVLGYSGAEIQELGEAASLTAVGITMVGELVYNFPLAIAPIAAVILGLLFRWMYETFLVGLGYLRSAAVAVYSSWWYGVVFASFESNFAGYFSGTVKVTIATLLLFWLLRIRAAKPQRSMDVSGSIQGKGSPPDTSAAIP